MHIVLGILGAIVTILYLLNNLGIDLGGLNPWSWRRRRAWAKKYEGDPIYSVEDPMQVAALLIVGAAKLDGDLSAEQKKAALDQFESRFSLDPRAASELFGSATYLLGAPQIIGKQLEGLVDRNRDTFTQNQAESMMEMIEVVASADGDLTASQKEYLDRLRSEFVPPNAGQGTWA